MFIFLSHHMTGHLTSCDPYLSYLWLSSYHSLQLHSGPQFLVFWVLLDSYIYRLYPHSSSPESILLFYICLVLQTLQLESSLGISLYYYIHLVPQLCQDSLSTELTSTRSGRINNWEKQSFHQNNEKDNLFPSGGEVQGFHQNN